MDAIILKRIMKCEILVESESVEGAYYFVKYDNSEWTCTCPHKTKGHATVCKHIEEAQRRS